MVATMIYDHEWRGAEVRRNFGVLTLSLPTFRSTAAQYPGPALLNLYGAVSIWVRLCHFLSSHSRSYLYLRTLLRTNTFKTSCINNSNSRSGGMALFYTSMARSILASLSK